MTHHPALSLALALGLALTPLAVRAQPDDLPPGLVSARLLPGWTDAEGNRILALELELAPGWKTYWRSPGDTGLPPQFDWQGAENLAGVTLHWPAPQAIRSGEVLEMGYHDRLILPFTAHPADPGQPVRVRAQIDIGLCENICVPAALDLTAPPSGSRPDPAIAKALAAEPQRLDLRPACTVTPLADGLRVAMALPPGEATLAAIELTGQPQIWVSGAEIAPTPEGAQAVVEMVGPTAAPFDLDPAALRLTVIPADGTRATEMTGCAPVG
jgi:DsbC/DsbD-like thiol-disulfide interchange protein